MRKIDPLSKRDKGRLFETIRSIIRKAIKEQTDKYSDTLEMISDGRIRKVVIRGGKRKVKMKTNQKGQKIVGGKAVKMGAAERIRRGRGAIKAARKRKGKQARITKKRGKSMKKRARYGLDTQH